MKPTANRLTAAVVAALSLGAVALSYAGQGAAQTQPAAATYEVRLHRPAVVGRRARVTSEGVKHQTVRVVRAGRPAEERLEDLRVHFRAVERVVAVLPNGKARQSDYTVELFSSDDERGNHVLARRGQVLSVVRGARGAEATVTLDGLPVPPATRSALAAVVSLSASDVTDDDTFGTTARQPVGGAWPMHADVAQRDLEAASGMRATLTGQTRLERAATVQRTPCLELAATMDGTVTTMPRLPPGSIVRTGNMHVALRGMFPVAGALPALTSSMEMTMELVIDTPASGPQPAGQIQLNMRETKTETFTPLGG